MLPSPRTYLTAIALTSMVSSTLAPAVLAQQAKPKLETTVVKPTRVEHRGAVVFVDFGLDAYGNLQLKLPRDTPASTLTVRLGEKLAADGTIDRKPPGSVNYREIKLETEPGKTDYQLKIPSKKQHDNPKAVHTPAEIGEVTVFRYAEIEGAPATFDGKSVSQLFVHTAFDDKASSFESSDQTLNAVWDLCKHTMKATTAFGVYIDGERERIAYEADAYINQLSHLAVDANPEVARYSVEHLLANPTWPTEWSFHMPMMAAADYQLTGDISLSDHNYDALKKKLLMDKAREDEMLKALAIIDWPSAERDGYNEVEGINTPSAQSQQIGPEINTVANAFYYHALRQMAQIARATNRLSDAELFESKSKQVEQGFNSIFFDKERGVYIDGEGSKHASLHANMFAMAFDLVPAANRATVADFIQSRGMACSVYGAQYLLEALYKADKADYALQLMTSKSDRGWWHMIELGSTMTLEAWDAKYKKNLTWNHAWGAAPGNIISRFLLGVQPLEPGYKKILIAPQPGTLAWAKGKVPTVAGPVSVDYRQGKPSRLEVVVPRGTTARIQLPDANHTVKDGVGPGKHVFKF